MQIKRFFLSFKYACEGIYHAFKQEQNLKIHLLAACLVVIMGVFSHSTNRMDDLNINNWWNDYSRIN